MNILFANHSDFGSNSLNHIGAFANRLTLLGHACAVAVPENPESISAVPNALFTAATYERALHPEPLFPDRRPADILHVWTPRERLREFALSYLHQNPAAALVCHLEDNEVFLMESYAHAALCELRALSDEETIARLTNRLSHPVRFKNFLRLAHATTYITDRLREFVPAGKFSHRLLPGVDPALYHPFPPDADLRAEIGVKPHEKLLVYTGSSNFANHADVRALMLAVRLINEQGTPCKLVRTGINPPHFERELAALAGEHIIDLGYVEKGRLGPLLSLADVLVQPGAPDDFNDYRLPSKLPEFLSVGRPVITTRANIAREMEDGRHALLLVTGAPAEIADHCLRIFGNAALSQNLSVCALEFARAHFDLAANTAGLLDFYERVKSTAQPLAGNYDFVVSEDVLLAEGDAALRLRAKEQSIEFLQRQTVDLHNALAGETEKITGLKAGEIAALKTTIISLQAAQSEQSLREYERAAASAAEIATLQSALTEQHAQAEREKAAAAADLAAYASTRDADLAAYASARAADLATMQTAVASLQTDLARQTAEASERAARAATEIAALQSTLADVRAAQTLRETYDYAERLSDQAQIEILQQKLVGSSDALAQAARNLADAQAAHEATDATLRQRESRMQRMTQSASWQLTSPLRFLRRLLLDPLLRVPGAVAPLPPTPDPRLVPTIDEPADWCAVSLSGVLRGWLVDRAGYAINGVRARIGDRVLAGEHGLSRPDVGAAMPTHPHAQLSGFAIACALPSNTTHNIVLEAQTADGQWRCFGVFTARIAAEVPEDQRRDYASWVRRYDTLTPGQISALRARLAALPYEHRPLISVLLPTYNTPECWLAKAINSVRAQIYPHWELCIADDASTAPHVRLVLEDFARRDPRLKIVFREKNGHISAASNSALALATGEWLALFDHDDELPPHALAEIVLELGHDAGADLIYSDEDKIDEHGRRYDPYFKPDWNPDLFNAQNFISHLGAYRTSLVRDVGGFRIGYEGSQDWDLAMRIIELTTHDRIRHIPKILYHWRSVPGSTAKAIGEKSYAVTAAEKTIADHFRRIGIGATLSPVSGCYWRVHYPLPNPPPRVCLVIPTRNALHVLRPCLESIRSKTTYPNYEILLVDNNSDDPAALAYLHGLAHDATFGPLVRVLRYAAPFNYSKINNFAAAHTDAPLVALLNNDLEIISPDWLGEMVSHALRPEIGCVGAMLYYPDNRIQHAGVVLGLGGVAGHAWLAHPRGTTGHAHRAALQQNFSAVTAACLVLRREIYLQVGGLDEGNLAVAFNDVDFCLRVRAAGYRNLWTPCAEFYHHESVSRGVEDSPEKLARFHAEVAYMRKKWGPLLDDDPAYNPNLALDAQDFRLAFPPRSHRRS